MSAPDREIATPDSRWKDENLNKRTLFERLKMFRVIVQLPLDYMNSSNKQFHNSNILNFNWDFQIWQKKHLIARNLT
jgi:hypothetical protein